MYNKEIITSTKKLRASWANKVENSLYRLGNYLGEVANYAALPDYSTKNIHDWYFCLDDKQVYVNSGSAWEELNKGEIVVTDYALFGLEESFDGVVDAKIYGATFSNVVGYSGRNVANAGSVSFTSITNHIYFNVVGSTINSRITGNGSSKSITNSTGKVANIIAIDLTQMGALDAARANYYSNKYGYVVVNWVDVSNQDLFSEICGEFFVVKSVGFDEIGAKSTRINDGIYSIELHSLNGYSDYLDTVANKKTSYNRRETVTVASNSATLSKAGMNGAVVFNENGIYFGSVSGTTLTVNAADGEYEVIYNLATSTSEDINIKAININEGTGVVWDSSDEDSSLTRVNPITVYSVLEGTAYYADGILLDRKIKNIELLEVFDGYEYTDISGNATSGTSGYGLIIDGVESGDIIRYRVELNDSIVFPAFEIYKPATIVSATKTVIDNTRELKEIIRTNKIFINTLTDSIRKIGVEDESHAVLTNDSYDSKNFKQIADIEIYGQTFINELTPTESLADGSNPESIADRLIANHKYIVYAEGKANDVDVLDSTLTVTNGVDSVEADPWTDSDTEFVRRFITFTPEDTEDWEVKAVTGETVTDPVDYTFKGLNMVDLTAMGEMSAPMQEKYGVVNWEDMTDSDLESIFDNVGNINGMKCIGFDFSARDYQTTINNHGDSISNSVLSFIKLNEHLAGIKGNYDVWSNGVKTARNKILELQNADISIAYKADDKLYIEIDTEEVGTHFAALLDYTGKKILTSEDNTTVEWDSSNESSILTRI